jgi:hypothetical protein
MAGGVGTCVSNVIIRVPPASSVIQKIPAKQLIRSRLMDFGAVQYPTRRAGVLERGDAHMMIPPIIVRISKRVSI